MDINKTQVDGLGFFIKRAKVIDVQVWERKKDGAPQAKVQVQYWGGTLQIGINPAESGRYEQFRNKEVALCGSQGVEISTFDGGTKVSFEIHDIQEIK